MNFSLLYKTEETPPVCDILYDLSTDRAMKSICPDPRKREYFLDILSKPLRRRENILYRQQIYSDFARLPELFSDLKTLFTRYDRIKSDWQELKLSAAPASSSTVNPEALLEHTYASLKVTAIFPNTIVSFFHSLCDTLKKYSLRAEGLLAIRDYCEEMIRNDSFSEIVRIAQLFRYHTPEHYTFGMAVDLDETLRVSSLDLCEITEYDPKAEKTPLFRLFSKKDEKKPPKADVPSDGASYEKTVHLLNIALCSIDSALTQVTNNLYGVFYGIGREMLFYETALLYREHMASLGLPLTLPEISEPEDNRIVLHTLYDLVLAAEAENAERIVPNDVEIDGVAGILVKGLTDTGKTVYLRSAGAAQLFGQAGLPVLAQQAHLSIRNAFFSHFSSAEEEFLTGDASGRFDQEAKEIAHILDRLQPYSMVFLNETFQTTSYQEGTLAIFRILSVLPRTGTKFLFVTHLTKLFSLMDKTRVCLMETDNGKQYRLKRIR